MAKRLNLGEIVVDVVFKDIKNVHLSVYPPTGRVRISAPARMSLDTIRVFAISKLGWIKHQRKKLQGQERETPREYLDRESHYVWGKRYLLQVIEDDAPPLVELRQGKIRLQVRRGTPEGKRQAIIDAWYRGLVKSAVPPLIAKWEPILGVKVERFFVQKMKTKWGSCNANSRNIRLNVDLARKSPECLEYILVHELAHLIVRHHDEYFTSLMDRYFPNWRHVRQSLNAAPLAHAEWLY